MNSAPLPGSGMSRIHPGYFESSAPCRVGTKRRDARTSPARRVGMDMTRREFLARLGLGGTASAAAVPPPKTAGAVETTAVCPFCGVGCGQVVSVKNGQVVSVEGDRNHPINEGTALQQGRRRAGDEQPPAPQGAALSPARKRSMGRKDLGLGAAAHRGPREDDP